MDDLERVVRETLAARVAPLTDERIAADLPQPGPPRPRRRHHLLLPLAAAVAVAAVAIGVGGGVHYAQNPRPEQTHTQPPPPPDSSILLGFWTVKTIVDRGRPVAIPSGGVPAITFKTTSSATLDSGCEQLRTSVRIKGKQLTFGSLIFDAPLSGPCPAPTQVLARKVLAIVPRLDHWSATADTLQLTSADGSSMTFGWNELQLVFSTKPLEAGRRDGTAFQLMYAARHGHVFLEWHWAHSSFGIPTSVSSLTTIAECGRANSRASFVFGLAAPGTTRAEFRPINGPPTELTMMAIPGSPAKAFGRFVEPANSTGTVTAYRVDGSIVGSKPVKSCN